MPTKARAMSAVGQTRPTLLMAAGSGQSVDDFPRPRMMLPTNGGQSDQALLAILLHVDQHIAANTNAKHEALAVIRRHNSQ